jgi:LysR family transcriptional regulator, regulator of abg operon
MRLQQLHLLLAIAENGSLRAAAGRLNVTQPALTKALHQLEAEFGAALVVRTPKGVRLAAAGEILAARAASIVREVDRAREEVAWHLRHASARVSVGLSPVAALMLAPGAVVRFAARWPQVRLRIVDALYPRAFAQVRSNELDFAIGPLPEAGTGHDLAAQPLFYSEDVIVARRGHALARARRLADLVDAAWVLTGPAGGPGDPAGLGFETLGLRAPQVRLECESFTTLLALMASHDVVGVMPRAFFACYAAHAALMELPIEDPLPMMTVHAVSRADAPLTVPAQHLLDAFVQETRVQRSIRAYKVQPRVPRASKS